MRLDKMRTAIMVSIGLQMGCTTTGVLSTDDTDEPVDTGTPSATCDEQPKVTAANAIDAESGGLFLVCGDRPENGGSCPSLEDLEAYGFLYEALGPPSDVDFCGWDAVKVCGPEESIKDQCCYVLDVGLVCEGRPLRLDGQHAFATTEPRDGWAKSLSLNVNGLTDSQRQCLGELWRESAQAEHASVAAFAGFVSELLTLGAPSSLVMAAQQAMGDEIHHAKACFSLMSAFMGKSYGPGVYPQATMGGTFSMENMLRNLVLDGCINETIAAAIADAESEYALDAEIREILSKIATDERKHATLAWKTLHWVLKQHPEWSDKVRTWFDEGIAAHWNQEYPSHSWTHGWGRLSGAEKGHVVRAALTQVVGPCGVQVLNSLNATESFTTTRA